MPCAPICSCSRRSFLGTSLGCGAYLALAMAGAAGTARRAFAANPTGETVITKPFARIEKIADGVWATVSTPMKSQDYTTVSNGGIIAGRDGVLLIEGHNTPAGGAWAAEAAWLLTGKRPTHIIVTHVHGDHVNGLSGCLHPDHPAEIIATQTTRRLMAERAVENVGEFDAQTRRAKAQATVVLPNTVIQDAADQTTIDLGGRTATIRLRRGHTPSDVTIEIDDPRVIFCGDLVFNGMFPYYGDAIPTALSTTCRDMCRDPQALYVPGHGSLATAEELAPFLDMLDHVGEAAQAAFKAGTPADEAWQQYKIPASLGEYGKFRPDVYRFAFEAWERELRGE